MSDAAPVHLALTRLTPSDIRTTIRDLDGRQVVWAEFDADDQPTRLTSASSEQLVAAAAAARARRLPLVLVLSTSGADINEGVPALHAWGRVAAALTACSGVVPTAVIVSGPAVSGPACSSDTVPRRSSSMQAGAPCCGSSRRARRAISSTRCS